MTDRKDERKGRLDHLRPEEEPEQPIAEPPEVEQPIENPPSETPWRDREPDPEGEVPPEEEEVIEEEE